MPVGLPMWNMDNWEYLERQLVPDPKGREWTVALMDVLGQQGDPEMPSQLLEAQYASGRYFVLIYSSTGSIQLEQGFTSLWEATERYSEVVADVVVGSLDPAQPEFRAGFED